MAALPAEALRVLLVAARRIDDPLLRDALDALTSALGLLKPPDAQGVRAIAAPVRLLEDPAAWFRSGVLDLSPGGALDADRIIDLLEAVKPFIGLAGTPRGTWPIVPGITLATTSGSDGPTIALAIDATAWLTAPAPIAAGVTLALTLPAAGAPRTSSSGPRRDSCCARPRATTSSCSRTPRGSVRCSRTASPPCCPWRSPSSPP
jgi:hypothetical protein